MQSPDKEFEVTSKDGSKTVTVKLYQDTDCPSPRENDNLGTMVCWHRNYNLGDVRDSHKREMWDDSTYFDSPEEFAESDEYKNAAVILPLRLYDHSGISMSVGRGAHMCDPGGWDSGQVGWIYISKAKVREEYSCKRIGKKLLARVEGYLRNEVEEYDRYITGDCYGYVIEDEDGEELDSCWGFIGHEYAEEEARSQGEYQVEQLVKAEQEEQRKEAEAKLMERNCFAL